MKFTFDNYSRKTINNRGNVGRKLSEKLVTELFTGIDDDEANAQHLIHLSSS